MRRTLIRVRRWFSALSLQRISANVHEDRDQPDRPSRHVILLSRASMTLPDFI
jgi:hypothetical protein